MRAHLCQGFAVAQLVHHGPGAPERLLVAPLHPRQLVHEVRATRGPVEVLRAGRHRVKCGQAFYMRETVRRIPPLGMSLPSCRPSARGGR